jgi:putative phosphoesterase
MRSDGIRFGVISDTHGLLRPQVLPLLADCDRILHLGDVGNDEILDALATIAPVTAVRGNVDRTGRCAQLPETEIVSECGVLLYLLHDRQQLDLVPQAAGLAAVLSGHTHQPQVEWKRGVLFLNPGACGPRRFRLPLSCAWLDVDAEGRLSSRLIPVLE